MLRVGPKATIPDISRIRTLPYLSIVLKEGIESVRLAASLFRNGFSLIPINSSSPLSFCTGQLKDTPLSAIYNLSRTVTKLYEDLDKVERLFKSAYVGGYGRNIRDNLYLNPVR